MMLPLLQYSDDGKEHKLKEAVEALADYFDLTEEDRNELLPSGQQTVFYNRIGWAKTYLIKAHLLESTGRGRFQITKRGYQVLDDNPSHIDRNYLNQFQSFQDFQQRSSTAEISDTSNGSQENGQTPEELMESTHRQLRDGLTDDLLDATLSVTPAFFERMVVDLLLAMGYGSTLDSGDRIGKSGDGGVDGVIREDKLGLDTIYIQAKRYNRSNGVGRPAIQAFVGSLMGLGATKGVFITTSYFSNQARDYAGTINNLKIILIDGEQLARLLIEHNVGVSVKKTYIIKQIDENYFPDA
jgi:restriction system protein